MNANFFKDLTPEEQTVLLNYIADHFVPVSDFHNHYTSGWLKQRFTRLNILPHHVTKRCFMEAMLKCGFKAIPVSDTGDPDWYLNVGKLHFKD